MTREIPLASVAFGPIPQGNVVFTVNPMVPSRRVRFDVLPKRGSSGSLCLSLAEACGLLRLIQAAMNPEGGGLLK